MSTELELLKFVFNFHVVDQIVRADSILDDEEVAWMVKHFPREALVERGLIDASNRLTERYAELLEQALLRVPDELDQADKLVLIESFFSMARVDGDLDGKERRVILLAADLLGVPTASIQKHLDTFVDDLGDDT